VWVSSYACVCFFLLDIHHAFLPFCCLKVLVILAYSEAEFNKKYNAYMVEHEFVLSYGIMNTFSF
jgi:hypothetical protein